MTESMLDVVERIYGAAERDKVVENLKRLGEISPQHNLRFLQLNLPWSPNYSVDFRSNPQSHKDFTHAVLHIVKAAGNLAAVSEDWDHHRPGNTSDAFTVTVDAIDLARQKATKALADLVICAMRAASVLPGGSLDLAQAVVSRIETKNDVKL